MSFYEQSQRILSPVRAGYIALTFAVALLFNLLPWRDVVGLPDMVALVLTFWCVHEPRRTGIGIAWLMGLLMDAGNGALLGQHAFAYAVLAFAAISLHRRILWFSLWRQAAHVLVLSREAILPPPPVEPEPGASSLSKQKARQKARTSPGAG